MLGCLGQLLTQSGHSRLCYYSSRRICWKLLTIFLFDVLWGRQRIPIHHWNVILFPSVWEIWTLPVKFPSALSGLETVEFSFLCFKWIDTLQCFEGWWVFEEFVTGLSVGAMKKGTTDLCKTVMGTNIRWMLFSFLWLGNRLCDYSRKHQVLLADPSKWVEVLRILHRILSDQEWLSIRWTRSISSYIAHNSTFHLMWCSLSSVFKRTSPTNTQSRPMACG